MITHAAFDSNGDLIGLFTRYGARKNRARVHRMLTIQKAAQMGTITRRALLNASRHTAEQQEIIEQLIDEGII